MSDNPYFEIGQLKMKIQFLEDELKVIRASNKKLIKEIADAEATIDDLKDQMKTQTVSQAIRRLVDDYKDTYES